MEWGFLPNTVALAAVALLGYMFGRSALRRPHADPNQMRREFQRSREVVSELERISLEMRRHLAAHHGSVAQIHQRLVTLQSQAVDEPTQEFCRDAQRLLSPTRQMAQQMTHAYDALRRQSAKLNAFNDVRVDSLTGLSSRVAMNESIAMLLAMKRRYRSPFALAIVAIDGLQQTEQMHGSEARDETIRTIAQILQANVRETDIVARVRGGEFVVLMPETDLEFSAVVARRARRIVQRDTDHTLSSGLTAAIDDDEPDALLYRAEVALNAARTCGANSIKQHDGEEISAVATTPFLLMDDAQPEAKQPSGATYEATVTAACP